MASGLNTSVLQHLHFSSFVDVGLWSELATAKLNSMRLNDDEALMWGSYAMPLPPARTRDLSMAPLSVVAAFCVDKDSLDSSAAPPHGSAFAPGAVKVVNTMESFKETDKKAFIELAGQRIVADIVSGEALNDTSLLSRWAMLVFSNLKAYTHTYWLAFPAVCTPKAATLSSQPAPVTQCLSLEQISQLHAGYSKLEGNRGSEGFFVISIADQGIGELSVLPLKKFEVYFRC